jgi:hypothetical protein
VEFRFARSDGSDGSDDFVVGHQFAVWNLRPAHEVWACLRRACGGDRIDGLDGVLCDARFCGCGLERRKRSMIPSQAARWPEIAFEIGLKPRTEVHSIIPDANGWLESGLRPKAERLDFPYCEHY